MITYLTIKDGHEEGVNSLIPIERGMEEELTNTIDHLLNTGQDVDITCGQMTDNDYRENSIKSVMYGECCDREQAIKIVGDE